VTDFHHPGGNYLITKIVGRQIGRFLFGNYSLEEINHEGYMHSKKAYQIL